MISRRDLDERVRQWQLSDAVVEKDYVIGWVLWGIGSDSRLSAGWAFKGGTCLKKCYVETFRFSEDLDFSVLPGGPFQPDEVTPLLADVLDRVQEESGVDFSRQEIRYRLRPNGASAEGRIYYVGPRRARQVARIKLDVTNNEEVVRPTVLRTIGHSYPDSLPDPATVRCYAFEEVFAEKLRALGERGRPRDLYDVVLLFRRHDLRQNPDLIQETLVDKCETKGVPAPSLEQLTSTEARAELEAEWENMLGHQLPELPPFDPALEELPSLFEWLAGTVEFEELAPVVGPKDEDESWAPPPLAATWGGGVSLEVVRFAASNHLCVELGYGGAVRLIEPYSLRRTRAGKLLLYAMKVRSGDLRSYRVDRIESVRATRRPFRPRVRIEFTPRGPLRVPPTSRRHSPRSRSVASYTVECTVCGRRFPRKRRNPRIKPHKDRSGLPCSGRRGFFV